MIKRKNKTGFSLVEMMVAMGIVALVLVFSMPALRTVVRSFGESGSAEGIIGPAMASARAIAAKENRYAGIRFQQTAAGEQYAVFIMHDYYRANNLANGFIAVPGMLPIRFPSNTGVMSGIGGTINSDTTRVSIVFSPNGRLIIHDVRTCSNKSLPTGTDTVFGGAAALFSPDGGNYPSDKSLKIYDANRWKQVQATPSTSDDSDFITALQAIYINPYTGTIMGK
jgi:prepilin-type N-terminal cleavage/methylation domain-containing protein